MYILKPAALQYVRSLNVGSVGLIKEKTLESLQIDIHGTVFVDFRVYFIYRLYLQETYDVTFVRDDKTVVRSLRFWPLKHPIGATYYVTLTLYFNMFRCNQHTKAKITRVSKVDSEVGRVDEVVLSQIRWPGEVLNDCILHTSLVSYFRISRILDNNDVITLNPISANQISSVFYRVSHAKPCFKVDHNTRLLQNASISSMRPSTSKFNHMFTPSSINKTVGELSRIFGPVFDQEGQSTITVNSLVGSAGSGHNLIVNLLADMLGVNMLTFDCFDLWNTEGKPTDPIVSGWSDKIKTFEPCIIHLENLHILEGSRSVDINSSNRILEILSQMIQNNYSKAVLFISCSSIQMESLPKAFTKLMHFKFVLDDLNDMDREDFAHYLRRKHIMFDQEKLLGSIRGMTLSELNQLIEEAGVRALKDNREMIAEGDLEWAFELRNKAFGDSVGVPKIPNVTWNDVGGLEEVKQLISESLNVNLDHKQNCFRRSGVVLYGPPGCGKTLIAKAVANEFKMTFLSVKGPELLNQYIGQSEKNLRQVFERAKAAAPSVVFFDELDSLAPSRGVAGDSGGVMDRMVSQLLSELDALQFQKTAPVFVMGATNRPDLLDRCLLSPGRFDQLIEVKLASDLETKTRILTPICKKVSLHQELTVEMVAKLCPSTMSGAELSSVISKAAMAAVEERIHQIEEGNTSNQKKPVQIHQVHIIQAIRSL